MKNGIESTLMKRMTNVALFGIQGMDKMRRYQTSLNNMKFSITTYVILPPRKGFLSG